MDRRFLPPIPDRDKPLVLQDPVVLMAMCIWGEARGCTFEGKVAVGDVIMNRLGKAEFDPSHSASPLPTEANQIVSVITKPWAFSSLNPTDPNRGKVYDPIGNEGWDVWISCFAAAVTCLSPNHKDGTGKAVFYYSLPLDSAPHVWGDVEWTTTKSGLHLFCQSTTKARLQ